MQIVIDIDEEIYRTSLPYKDTPLISNEANDYPEMLRAVANGTPLPKGHGKLIDASNLLTVTDIRKDGTELTYVPYEEIENAEAIIEADTESEDKE